MYRVMEYLDPAGSRIIGWVFLSTTEYGKWKKHPRSRSHRVTGYGVICGMETMGEHGAVPCHRMWDYFQTLAELPTKPFAADDLEAGFELAADHPTLRSDDGPPA